MSIYTDHIKTHEVFPNNWKRDSINGYIYPKTLTDRVGIGTATPATELDVNGEITSLSSVINSVATTAPYTKGLTVGAGHAFIGRGSFIFFPSSTSLGYGSKIVGRRSTLGNGKNDLVFMTGANDPQERLIVFDDGIVSIEDNVLNMNSHQINEVADPTLDQDAATKKYADDNDFWERDATNGYIYPSTLTDKVGIGKDDPTTELDVNGDATVQDRDVLRYSLLNS